MKTYVNHLSQEFPLEEAKEKTTATDKWLMKFTWTKNTLRVCVCVWKESRLTMWIWPVSSVRGDSRLPLLLMWLQWIGRPARTWTIWRLRVESRVGLFMTRLSRPAVNSTPPNRTVKVEVYTEHTCRRLNTNNHAHRINNTWWCRKRIKIYTSVLWSLQD